MASFSKDEIVKLKEKLNGEFEMKDLGPAKRVLGIDILRNRDKCELFLSQLSYLKKVVERFRMSNSKTVSTPLGHHTKLSIKQFLNPRMRSKQWKVLPMQVGLEASCMVWFVVDRT